MDIKAAVKIIIECAKLYEENLLDKHLLIVHGNDIDHIHSFQVLFGAEHFLHLTGIQCSSRIPATRFFKLALNSKLPLAQLSLKSNGTTELKLGILKRTMSIHKQAKMVGDYSHTKAALYTEKLAGTTAMSLGFIRDTDELYVPNTVLREDIRDITLKPQSRILAMYPKKDTDEFYTHQTYLAPNVNPDKFPPAINAKIKVPVSATNT